MVRVIHVLSNRGIIFFAVIIDIRQFSLKFVSEFCSKKRSHVAIKVARRLGSVSRRANCRAPAFNVQSNAKQHLAGCHHKYIIEMRPHLPFLTRSVIGERNNR